MPSLNSQLTQLAGLVGKKDVCSWEQKFITSILQQSSGGKDTTALSEKQVLKIEEMYERHFCGG